MFGNTSRTGRWIAVALAIGLLSSSAALAKKGGKPGGGGGGGGDDPPTIAGQIYLLGNGFKVASILPDGSNLQQFPDALIDGDPSHSLHGGQRWFADGVDVAVGSDPNGASIYYTFPDGRLLQAIEVGDEGGGTVTVVDDLDIAVLTPPRWTPDDLTLSFIGERWAFDSTLEEHTVVEEAGLYLVDLAYDALGVLGPIPGSLRLALDLSPELRINLPGPGVGAGLEVNQVNGHSWAPLVDGQLAAFVFAVGDGYSGEGHVSEIWTVDLNPSPNPATDLLVSGGNGAGWPEWSPDGSRIGYSSWDGIQIVNLLTGQSSRVRRKSSEYWGSPQWSPDGAHFAASRFDFMGSDNKYDLYRFSADGRGKTRLLADQSQATPLGWRSLGN